LPFCVLNDSVPALREPATDWLIPPVVASVTDPVVVNAPAKLRATLSVRISAPAPSDTAPRLVIVLDAALSVTAPFCVLNASVPAVTPLVAAWEMPALAPVIVSETDPVVLSEPARVSDEVLERAKLPEPNVTTPRLVIVFCEALSVAAPFCVLNDSVPTLRTPVAARVIAALLPAVAKLTDPVVASVPANVRDALFVRLRAPDPSDTLPRVPIVFVTDPSETSALCVVIDSVLAAIAPEADCVMPDRLPVVAIVTDPVVLSVPAKVRAALLVMPSPLLPLSTLEINGAVGAVVSNVNDLPTGAITIAGTAVQNQEYIQSNIADIKNLGAKGNSPNICACEHF
jgi:hypothetical protein